MKRLVNIFLIIGYVFWGIFLFSGLINLFYYNGLHINYIFNCITPSAIRFNQDRNVYIIHYDYVVNGNNYAAKYSITEELYKNKIKDNQLHVCYNVKHPKYSYIQEANISLRKHKVTIIVSSIFILIISIFGLIAKREYWIKKYQEFYQRL